MVAVALALLASGTALTGMSSAAETDPYWGLLVLRGTAFVLMVGYLAVSRRGLGAPARRVPGLLLIGALDATATGLFAVATTYGYLSVVSVIASLFPLGTIALARLMLGERILPHQNVGVGVALTGVACVALG